jgi:CO/xanthine dehydrogenase FAD-binding subunit
MNAHPRLPKFDYLQPTTLLEASEFLSQNPDAYPYLGGTDLFVRMRKGSISPRYLIDIKQLSGLDELSFDPQAGLTVGAAVNMNRVINSPVVQRSYPLLAEACRTVASYQLRTRATIAGNICNASPAGDTIGACLLLDARLHIHGLQGYRHEPLSQFFLGPGKTILEPGDIVTAIHFPLPPEGAKGRYVKLGRNRLGDLSIVGVTAFGYPNASLHSGYLMRIALASVAPVPLIVPQVGALLSNSRINKETIQEAGQLAAEACSPIDDVRGSTRYRKQMVKNLSIKALTGVWEELSK